ncbi:MAG: hypothetical protein JRN11_08340 [Nitrososphaerota archaeon]|nr:hypothetical protein [Nitrososphaerota archaeon]MDG6974027.1 hypothetical protein [Nitrososphaerota archaeon]MDG7026743.1 hypothetical protein [Nitrososphaerota archaeon]
MNFYGEPAKRWRGLKYRPSVLVYMEILTILTEGPQGPTKLSRRANISYDRLPAYTEGLLQKGAIRKDSREGHDEYALTAEGAEALSDLQKGLRRLPL